jgi:UDP-N-acetylmuramoylalanine--D-glutamate ligase
MDKFSCFGNGITVQAIAQKFTVDIFDDHIKEPMVDRYGNHLYPSSLFDPENSAMEVTSPGIPPSHPLIQNAQHLISEYDLFADAMPYSIWISGTNGKTTTTGMITHLLAGRGALSGGNIGNPLALLDQKAPIWVLETSSFTLHYTKKAKPNLYILLPISEDHISWHGSFEAYEEAKLAPIRTLKEGEIAIVPSRYKDTQTDGFLIPYGSSDDLAEYFDIDTAQITFQEPFLTDALLALAVSKILFNEIDYALINRFFVGEHKIEEFSDSLGRIWVDDSKATNVDATIEAVKRYKNQTVHLILGGDDKGADLTPMFETLRSLDITIYAIGTNTEKLMEHAKTYRIRAEAAHTLEKAVALIDRIHDKNSIALLSPACASFDQFSSYKQRGEIFKQNVRNLS